MKTNILVLVFIVWFSATGSANETANTSGENSGSEEFCKDCPAEKPRKASIKFDLGTECEFFFSTHKHGDIDPKYETLDLVKKNLSVNEITRLETNSLRLLSEEAFQLKKCIPIIQKWWRQNPRNPDNPELVK